MKHFKLFFTLLTLVIFGCGQMWGADYALYTSSTISAGDYIIVGQKTSDSKYYAMNNTCTSNQYMGIEQVTVSNNKITTNATNIVWTISSTTDGYYIKNGNNFLNDNATSSKNYAQTVSTASGTCVWSFSYANSKWSITNEGTTTTKNKLSFNMGNPRVACYASLQSGANQIYLYKKVTLSSIAVKTAPKTDYSEGEYFDPSDLVITLTYSDNSTEDVAYSGHASDFTFSPTTSTALETSNTSVSITYGGKSTSQAITVTASGCTNNITINKGSESHGTFTIDKEGSQATCSGLSVVVTPSAADHYHVGSVSATTGETGSDNGDGTWTITYAENSTGSSTINVVFAEDNKYTLNYHDGSGDDTKTNVYEGTNLITALGTPAASCDATSTAFQGWSTTEIATKTNTPPTFVAANAVVNSTTAAATYYAVYAKQGELESVKGGNIASDFGETGLSGSHSDFYSGNGFKFKAANNYVTTGDISSNNYKDVTVKLKAGHNGGSGSVLTIASLDKDGNTIDSETLTPSEAYTSQSTTYTFELSGSKVIKEVRVTMTSKTNNLGMKYCEVFHSSLSDYLTTCCDPLGSINGSVSFTNVSPTSVTVGVPSDYSDKDNANLTGYIFKRYAAASGGEALETIETNAANQTTATFNTGLVANTEYFYTIIAKHGSESCNSAETSPRKAHTIVSYVVSYANGGGTGDAPAAHDPVLSGTSVELKANTFTAPAGKQFANWNDGTNDYDPEDSYSVTGNKIMTAVWSCVTPTFAENGHPVSKTDYITTNTATALSYSASAAGASLSQQWQVSDDEENWDDIDGATSDEYTPNIATPGTKYYRVIVTNAAAGCSSATATSNAATITSTAPSGYCISLFNSDNNGIQNGFSNGGSGSEYTLNFTIPGKDGSNNWPQYWIGENNAWASFSAEATFADMKFTTSNATLGLAEGATGKLHIWDDNKEAGSNLWVKFEPSGYGFRWGGAGEWDQPANTKAFTVDANNANTYWTELVTLDGTNNTTWSYYVGLQAESGYVYSGVDDEEHDNRGISRTRSVTTMKVSNGTAGQYKATFLNSEPTGTTGKFRIWNNNITDYNFVCHWVPFYQLTYNGNGAAGSVAASDYICCEESAANRTIKAAANGFTVPTGKQFAGWATSANGEKDYDPDDDVVLTSDVELFAVWTDIDYTVTVNQNPSAGATLSGATNTAHYGGIINISTDVPSGYRFVNWTSSDVTITNPTSVTTASFTMPAKNVIVTANFQQIHTITWMVGGQALTGSAIASATNVVDAGQGITALPSVDDDDLGTCANKFMGWSKKDYKSVKKTASDYDDLFSAVSGAPDITGNTIFYAVFATSEDGTEKQTFTPGTDTGETSVTKGNATCTMTTMNNASYYQIYAGQSGTFTCSSGNVTKIEFTCTASGTSKYGPGNASADVGTYSYDGSTGTWTGSASSVTISSTAQVRMTSLEVTYESVNIKEYVTECAAVEAPTFSVDPADGPFNVAQSVELDCETDGATIYYTTDGTTPSDASTEYTSAIAVNQSMTLKAIAYKGDDVSGVAEATYTLKVATPTITSSPKHFLSKTNVSIASTTGATIYYTTDGSTPTTESSVYSAPFEISATTTVRAYAVKSGWTDSEKSESVTFTKVNEEDILTVAEARAAITAGTNLNGRYVHGKIYNVASYNSDHHSMVYWISDDGTGTVSNKDGLEIFNGLSGDYKAQFEGIGDLSVGDEVIVWGNLYKYNSTYELNQNNEIAKLMRDVAAPTFTPDGGGFLTTQHVTIASEVGATIYYSTDGTEPTDESTEYTDAGIDLSTTTTIKAIAYKGEDKSAIITKTFTKGSKITVADALEALDDNTSVDAQFVTGVVCTAPTDALNNGRLTYYIVDDLGDVTDDNKLKVYRGKDLNQASFDELTDIQVGDVVTVFGQLYKYQGTKEINENNYLLEFDRPTYPVTSITLNQTSATIEVGHTVDLTATVLPTYATDKSVEWSSDDSDIASVDNGVVTGVSAGTAVITVAATDGSNVAANCTITVYQWNLSGYTVTSAPATEYTEVDHFLKSSVAIQANYVRSDNPELTQDEAVAASAWSAKLGGNAIADNYQFALADDGKKLALYVGENKVWEETISVAEAPKDQFVVGIWDVAAPGEQTGTYTMPNLSDQTAAEGNCKDHNIFVGWVAEENADDLIDDNIIAGGTTGIVASNKTYHAVWAKPEEVDLPAGYRTVTSAPSSGTNVVLATKVDDKYYAFKNDGGENNNALEITLTNGVITSTDGVVLYYQSANKGFKASNTNDAPYLHFNSGNAKMASGETNADNVQFTAAGNGTFKISGNNTNRRWLQWNSTSEKFTVAQTADGGSAMYVFVEQAAQQTTINTDYRVDCSQRYTLSFDANGGNGSYDAVEKRENAIVTLPNGSALSLEFYNFTGWKVYYAGTETEITVTENQFTMPASAVVAVAQWTEQDKGTIRYVGDEIVDSPVYRYAGQTYNLRSQVTLPANKKLVGWTIEGDETLYAPGQQMTMPTPVEDITYHAQIITILPEPKDMDISTGSWVLVTNENQLHAGDFVVIVGNETTNALSVNQNKTNRGVASVTKENEGQNITLGEGVAPLFLQSGYMDGEFALFDMAYEQEEVVVGGYLYASSGSSNDLKTSTTYSSRDYSWEITIGDGNTASIVAQGTNSHNDLKYNSSATIFSCYANGQTAVQLYRYEGQRDVEITEDASTSSIYIENTNVTVKENVTLTVDAASNLDNLTVENGGKVVLDANKLTVVGTFTIETTMASGASGQVDGATASNFAASEAYIDITLGAAGKRAEQWHAFTVPFPVDAINGVFDAETGDKLANEVNYAIMDYHGDIRATGNYGWKKFRGIMTPGTFYLMTVDGERTTYRFKKKAGEPIVATNSKQIYEYPLDGGSTGDNGWNGVGNPTLRYGKVDAVAYVLNPESYEYEDKDPNSTNFVVGTPFFVVATADGSISMGEANASAAYAPRRSPAKGIENIKVAFGNEECTDYLTISASEDALNEYETGKDYLKMMMSSTPKVARIFSKAYGVKLCREFAPLSNDKASYDLTLYAPANGEYNISAPATEDAEVYLTKDGMIIWNLTMSEYTIDLNKGTTNGYGLLLVRKAPNAATGVDEINAEAGAQKVIIDDHVYILRGGEMYDVTGKAVK